MPSNHLILCYPLLLLPSNFASRIFSNESALCIRWPKYWSCWVSISPSSEYSGLISFQMGWFDLLAVQGILKSLLQHHRGKERTKRCSVLSLAFLCLLHSPPPQQPQEDSAFILSCPSLLQPPDLAWVIQRLQGSNPSNQEGGISNFLSSLHFSERKQVLKQYGRVQLAWGWCMGNSWGKVQLPPQGWQGSSSSIQSTSTFWALLCAGQSYMLGKSSFLLSWSLHCSRKHDP